MPNFGSLRPWEMAGFTYGEIKVLRDGLRDWDREMRKMRSAR